MNKRIFRYLLVTTVAIIALLAVRPGPAATPAVTDVAGTSPSTLAPPAGPGRARASSVAAAAPSSDRSVHPTPEHSGDLDAEERIVVVRPRQVVARVNGVEITGADLLAFDAAEGSEQTMSAAMFTFLRERAVDRQLVIEDARARGIELDAPRQRQLDALRHAALAQGELPPERVEFEVRDAAGPLLADALLAARGGRPPHTTQAEVDLYYSAHATEYEPLPEDADARAAARHRIDVAIRGLLNRTAQEAHQRAVRALLEELRGGAVIAEL